MRRFYFGDPMQGGLTVAQLQIDPGNRNCCDGILL
jgi:hypothetical protein